MARLPNFLLVGKLMGSIYSRQFRVSIFVLFALFATVATVFATAPPRVNERFALRAVRQIHSAQATYAATHGAGNYGTGAQLNQANLIDSALAAGQKFGYEFNILVQLATTTTPVNFTATATPSRYGRTGRISYFIDSRGYIHGADKGGRPANGADPFIYDCTNGSIEQNEQCSIQNIRTLHGAQMTYAATYGNGNYTSFQNLYSVNLISAPLSAGSLGGYNYNYTYVPGTPNTPATFTCTSRPISYGISGRRSFFIDQTGILRGADKGGAFANVNDPPINE